VQPEGITPPGLCRVYGTSSRILRVILNYISTVITSGELALANMRPTSNLIWRSWASPGCDERFCLVSGSSRYQTYVR